MFLIAVLALLPACDYTIVDQAGQALLTTTDWEDYPADFRRRAKLFSVTLGRLEEAGI